MIARERLYLTADRRRVVEHGNRAAAFLLAAQGAEIKKEYAPLVEQFYAAQAPEPIPEPIPPVAAEPAPKLTADVTEGYDTRIPTNIRRRGRPRRTTPQAGPGG